MRIKKVFTQMIRPLSQYQLPLTERQREREVNSFFPIVIKASELYQCILISFLLLSPGKPGHPTDS